MWIATPHDNPTYTIIVYNGTSLDHASGSSSSVGGAEISSSQHSDHVCSLVGQHAASFTPSPRALHLGLRGFAQSASQGTCVGLVLGDSDGDALGLALGDSEGEELGLALGKELGEIDGSAVGIAVGIAVGTLGCNVGALVGPQWMSRPDKATPLPGHVVAVIFAFLQHSSEVLWHDVQDSERDALAAAAALDGACNSRPKQV